MKSAGVERRLAAIVAADVAGYGRLTDLDETGTHAALMAHRSELLEPAIARHEGRVVKNTGDGLIAEFASILDAMHFAVDVQQGMTRRNADVPRGRRLEFRMGVNIGDVIVERGDIYGEGVNTAVRLEGLANPGGICVTSAVYEQVKNKLRLEFRDLGSQKVKNIAEPIHAHLVDLGRGSRRAALRRRGFRVSVPALAATAALVLGAATGAAWWQVRLRSPALEPEPIQLAMLPLPGKPSIAVLPFTNLSGDPSQEYFSDGITEDVITDLSRFSGLFVIARNTSFSYKDRQVDVRGIGRELGVRYLLEGSVRKADERVRINARLVDATTGGQLWAARYDTGVGDIFDVQDRVTRKIVTALTVKLTPEETAGRTRSGTSSAAAYDAYLRGSEYLRRRTAEDFSRAASHFKEAIALDPDYAKAHAALAATYLVGRRHLWHERLGFASRFEAEASVRASLREAMKRPTPLAHRVAARLLYLELRVDEALAEAERALALDPNDAENFALLSIVLTWSGRAQEAVTAIQAAMRLDPHYPPAYEAYLGVARYALNDFVNAAEHLRRAHSRNPQNAITLAHLLAAYGQLGRRAEAKAALATLDELRREVGAPPYSTAVARDHMPYKLKVDMELLLAGLRKANVPD